MVTPLNCEKLPPPTSKIKFGIPDPDDPRTKRGAMTSRPTIKRTVIKTTSEKTLPPAMKNKRTPVDEAKFV
jgi:hypothetical protein